MRAAEGAEHLIAVEPDAGRRALARALGADQALTPDEAAEALAGARADLVFECAGAPPAIQAAVDLVGRGGGGSTSSVSPARRRSSPRRGRSRRSSVTGSLAYLHDESAAAMDLIADGQVRVEPLHDATVPLERAAETFAALADDPGAAVKILVDPRPTEAGHPWACPSTFSRGSVRIAPTGSRENVAGPPEGAVA